MLGVVKTMKNPRSAVLKTSVMACTDVFAAFGNLISSASADAFDMLLLQLLLKAAQGKRVEEAKGEDGEKRRGEAVRRRARRIGSN